MPIPSPFGLRPACLLIIALVLGAGLPAEVTENGNDVAALLRKARAGDLAAQLEVSEHFLINATADLDGDPARDFQQVEKWLQAAALNGSAPAARMLGELLISDYPGVPVDIPRSFAAFQKAALGGDIRAMLEMGHFHSDGRGTPQDFAQAEEWIRKAFAAAPAGSPESDQAGRMLARLTGLREAAAEKAALAAGPDAATLYQRALAYGQGDGVGRDLDQAAQYLMAAAAQGHAEAQQKLRMFDFYPGMGRLSVMAKIKTKEGLAELTAAAERGDAEAQFALGLHDLIPDPAVKVGWFAKASAQRHRVAMYWLGRAYELGDGVRPDLVQSLAWYAQAALLGDRGAMSKVAEFYTWGYTGLKSPALAKYWKQQAAIGAPADDATAKYATEAANQIKEPAAKPTYALQLLREAATSAVLPGEKKGVVSSPTPPPAAPAPKPAPAAAPKVPPLEELRAAAANGDVESMYQLGLADIERRQIESNKHTGPYNPDPQRDATDFRWIMAAARAGHPGAQYVAATHWLSAETDAGKQAWLEKAAAQGHANAKERLAANDKAAADKLAAAAAEATAAAEDEKLASANDPDAAYRALRRRIGRTTKAITDNFLAQQRGQPGTAQKLKMGQVDDAMSLWIIAVSTYGHPEGLSLVYLWLLDEQPQQALQALLMRREVGNLHPALALKAGAPGIHSPEGWAKALEKLGTKLTPSQIAQGEAEIVKTMQHPGIINNLGVNFYKGSCGYPKVPEEAFRRFKQAAEAGLAIAQFSTALCYVDGIGTTADPAAARGWFEKAAAQGHPAAKQQLALLANRQSNADAWDMAHINAELLQRALSGEAKAQSAIGVACLEGKQVPQNYDRAFYWLSLAAEKELPGALHNLGMMFSKGYGRPVDKAQAHRYFLRAAEKGLADSQYNVGLALLQGTVVPSDPLAGHDWIKRAADQNHALAQTALTKITATVELQLLLAQREEKAARTNLVKNTAAILGAGPVPTKEPTPPPAVPVVDGKVAELNPGAFAVLQLIKKRNPGALNEVDAQDLKQAILRSDNTTDDAERDLLAEMTQSQFRSISVQAAGAKTDAVPVVLYPVAGNARKVLRELLQGKPDFEVEWNRGAAGFGVICNYYQGSPEAAAEVVRFVAGKFAYEWERSNPANGYKPLRDLIARQHGYCDSLGSDKGLGQGLVYRVMQRIDRSTKDQIPDNLYNWVRPDGYVD